MKPPKMVKAKSMKGLLRPLLGAVCVMGLAPAVHAATSPVTFAQATESSLNADANVFAYVNNGTSAELGTSALGVLGAGIPINFTFESGAGVLPLDVTGVQDATISMTSSTVSAAATAFGGTFADEPITGAVAGVTDTIKITRATPASEGGGARTNLLTITFTGNLAGAIGGTTPSLAADTALSDTVIYSSDFLSFAQSTQQDFNVAFSSWDPLITPPSGLGINADGFFNSAMAAGAATFDFQRASSGIPEPGSLPTASVAGMLAMMLCGRQIRGKLFSRSNFVL